MTGTTLGILLVCVCAISEGFGQVAFKLSVTVGALRFLWIAVGIGVFILDAVLYSAALRWLDVNVAFAIGSLGLVSIAFVSKWVLRETITAIRWAGIVLIVAGTTLIVSQV
jgi:multidrug transporter EmrE-like cation transporter